LLEDFERSLPLISTHLSVWSPPLFSPKNLFSGPSGVIRAN
jgi:hypothetical protein